MKYLLGCCSGWLLEFYFTTISISTTKHQFMQIIWKDDKNYENWTGQPEKSSLFDFH